MSNRGTKAKNQRRQIIRLICLVAILCISLYIVLSNLNEPVPSNVNEPNALLQVTVIDVGQADSSLVILETGQTMLIDAAEKSDIPAIFEELNEHNISYIDVLIGTHPHADHIGGMAAIIENYDVGAVYMPDKESESKTYQNLMQTINEYNVPLIEAYAGLSFALGEAQCTIVSPAQYADESANNESVALYVDYYESEFLFTGDMEEEAEEYLLLADYPVDADVLKVAHHGSSTGTSQEFLLEVTPQFAVISCGQDNKYGHPHEETIALLNEYYINVLRTDVMGDITFITDGYKIDVVSGD